jgi:hypothetical protein
MWSWPIPPDTYVDSETVRAFLEQNDAPSRRAGSSFDP